MKKIKFLIVFFVFGSFSFSAIAQEAQNKISHHASWWRLDFSLEYGSNLFYSSNISIINSDPQQTYISSNAGFSGRFLVLNSPNDRDLKTGMFVGINVNHTEVPLHINEKVNLLSSGLSAGFMIELSHITSMDLSFGVGWAQYKNDFSIVNKTYSYKKNGINSGIKSAIYFSPVEYVKIGLGIEYKLYKFKDNDNMIDDIPSQLPKESSIKSMNPFISLRVSI